MTNADHNTIIPEFDGTALLGIRCVLLNSISEHEEDGETYTTLPALESLYKALAQVRPLLPFAVNNNEKKVLTQYITANDLYDTPAYIASTAVMGSGKNSYSPLTEEPPVIYMEYDATRKMWYLVKIGG